MSLVYFLLFISKNVLVKRQGDTIRVHSEYTQGKPSIHRKLQHLLITSNRKFSKNDTNLCAETRKYKNKSAHTIIVFSTNSLNYVSKILYVRTFI